MATINLPFAASANRRAPGAELADGYPCGPLDEQLDNWLEWFTTGHIAAAIDAGGLTVDDSILLRLAQAIQSGKSTYAVATGTANAWVVAPNLAVPAYAAGRVLNIIAPATNSSTTVNMNVSGLGNRRIKKADGSDPAVGDLVNGVVYATIDDGTNIRVLTPLPSDMGGQVAQQVAVLKTPFNKARVINSTRTPLSGTGFVSFMSGSYNKQKSAAETDIEVYLVTNLYQASGVSVSAGIGRFTLGGVQANDIILVNANTAGNTASPHGTRVFTGLSAGANAFTFEVGRLDGSAWQSVMNPTNAGDNSNLPATQETIIQFQEVYK